MNFNSEQHTHRRLNPLTREWVLVSPHRTSRPWQGQVEKNVVSNTVAYDPDCYLCAGNVRANGEQNPNYDRTFIFTNDFSALSPEKYDQTDTQYPLLSSQPVQGTSRVICYSPDHSLTLPQLALPQIEAVIDSWSNQVMELSERYKWIQIFENKGSIMGCSNPHPHGQIWAMDQLPTEAEKEDRNQLEYKNKTNSNLLMEYIEIELRLRDRIVEENNEWVALVPYWATWPFELLLTPKTHTLHLNLLNNQQKKELAEILKSTLSRYDNLFQCSFPYSMGWHGRPFNHGPYDFWQLHAHFYPPLLRSSSIKKHMVGFEMLAEPQRDISPEHAAEKLRHCSPIHYSS